MPPRTTGLWHLALNVRDLKSMEAFYTRVLGYEVEWRPDDENVYLTTGLDNLALHALAGLPPPGTPSVFDHLGLFVEEMDDVDEWFRYVQSHEVVCDTEPRTHRDGARSFYFRDPELNRIQLLCHPPIVEVLKGQKFQLSRRV